MRDDYMAGQVTHFLRKSVESWLAVPQRAELVPVSVESAAVGPVVGDLAP
jgi:hypothetical protein